MNTFKKTLLLAAFGLLAATGINSASAADVHKDTPVHVLQQQHNNDVKKADKHKAEKPKKEKKEHKEKKEKKEKKEHKDKKAAYKTPRTF